MNTAHGATRSGTRRPHRRGVSPTPSRIFGVRFKNGGNARGYEPICYDLSDSELMDIGITRGEIDYVASNRAIDPRGIRSAE